MNVLGEKLQGIFKTLRGYGKLNENNIEQALREVRLALLAADVHYAVTKDFCAKVKERALGEEIRASVRPGDYFVKIVHDSLIELFEQGVGRLKPRRPLRIALCGLNGAGKTTTAAKLALYFRKKGESVRLVAADLSRPAAVEQLSVLAGQISVPVSLPEPGHHLLTHLGHVRENSEESVVLYDLAGRTDLNEELLSDLKSALAVIEADECFLVADAATGQAAAELARRFQEHADLTGIILSRFDGDSRGGAALSLLSVTGCPIHFLGTGEKVEALEVFQPERLVKRLLGMGDLGALAEHVTAQVNLEDAARLEEKLKRQTFDLQDFLDQMKQMKKLGPLQNLLGMVPGMGKLGGSALDEKTLKRTEAIILSMTRKERRSPEILNAGRRRRIACGSGVSVTEVNELLRRFREMKKMMTKLFRGGNPENKIKKLLSGMTG
ncbi:MAG: signal recognition particle protein [Candidatus Methylacidiphilales bacterium]